MHWRFSLWQYGDVNPGLWMPIGLSLGMGLGLAIGHNSDNNGDDETGGQE